MSGHQVSAVGEQTSLFERKTRAGQRLLLYMEGAAPSVEFKALCKELRPAGFVLEGRNVEEPAQLRELARELGGLVAAARPALIAMRWSEQGRCLPFGTDWPPLADLVRMAHLPTARAHGAAVVAELRAVGVNSLLDLPGGRPSGVGAEAVARNIGAWLAGAEGLAVGLGAFPGVAEAEDSIVAWEADPDEILRADALPFMAAIERGGPIGVAAAWLPAFDESAPAPLSVRVVGGLLREQLGHEGLVLVGDPLGLAKRVGRTLEETAVGLTSATVDMVVADPGPPAQHACWEAFLRVQEDDPAQDRLATDSLRRASTFRDRWLRPGLPVDLSAVDGLEHRMLAVGIRARGAG